MSVTETDAASWAVRAAAGPMMRGAVLVHAPSAAFQAPGGGETQLVQTARHLDALGVPVRPFSPWVDRLERARLLHLFGMSREGLELARVARAKRVPVIISPICWVSPRAVAALSPTPWRAAVDLAKWGLKGVIPRLGWRSELVGMADALLPNSHAEARQLVHYFGADPARIHVVPNGVEERFAFSDGEAFRRHIEIENFILYAGRIEPRKNVLGLAEAARQAALPLVVIGDPVPGRDAYARHCRERGGRNVRWISRLDHEEPLFASAYAAARVFALPSWFETPGLAALEAALARTPIVLTPYGCTREYFGDAVQYARPGRPSEIARALIRAWESPPDAALAAEIERRYLWSAVSRRTAEVYDQVAP